jgi:hypothetical protein
MAGCFRDYDNCVNRGSDFIDNLDCAVELARCVKRRIFAAEVRLGAEGGVAAESMTSLTDAINAVMLIDEHFAARIRREGARGVEEKKER